MAAATNGSSAITTVWAQFTLADLAPVQHDDPTKAGFQALCPGCRHAVLVYPQTPADRNVDYLCTNPETECTRSRIVDELHFLSKRGEGFVAPNAESANRALEPNPKVQSATVPRDQCTLHFEVRDLDPTKFRPTRFAWDQRMVIGGLNILLGEEGIGKGTLLAWIIAQLTTGKLPGDLHGKPCDVLWIGDEDAWEEVVGPRLWAAGADCSRVKELTHPTDYLYNARDNADQLERVLSEHKFRVVMFEQLVDNMPTNPGGDLTHHVRSALAPTRAVLRRHSTVGFATLHTRKGSASSFRELMAGSHQYNALSRAGLLLAVDPENPGRRLILPGKHNYSRPAPTLSFKIDGSRFDLNGHGFNVPRAFDFREDPDVSIASLLNGHRDTPVTDAVVDDVLDVLTDEPQRLKDIAETIGRDSKDGTVRNALGALQEAGQAEKAGRGLWQLKQLGAIA